MKFTRLKYKHDFEASLAVRFSNEPLCRRVSSMVFSIIDKEFPNPIFEAVVNFFFRDLVLCLQLGSNGSGDHNQWLHLILT
ncbi:hypothetical protein [Janthinobacterium sp.]|uniref:hypothetical protein n=1 Tax=Janthinobacterium sp. TaxID=1871054 RepID=UPI0026345E79|nr:hypothetical protein [Janthinobacterium sp.]